MKRQPKSLTARVAQILATIPNLEKQGHHGNKYDYLRAADVFIAFRKKLFRQGILIRSSEQKAEYVDVGENIEGQPVTECRLSMDFVLTDGRDSIGPDTHQGVGQSSEGKSLYIAKTGARKDYLAELALIPATDDPEFSRDADVAPDEDAAPRKLPASRKPVADFQVAEFQRACVESQKTTEEIERMLKMNFKVERITELQRRHFPAAIRWAMGSQSAPKLQAVATQKAMSFPVAARETEKKAPASSTKLPIEIDDSKGSFAI